MKCRKCEKKNVKKASYCKYCGNKFTEKEREEAYNKGLVARIKKYKNGIKYVV